MIRWIFSLVCVAGCSIIVGTEDRVLRDAGGSADSAVVNKEVDAAIVDAASPCDGRACAVQAECNNACKTELVNCEKQCKGNGEDPSCKQDCAAAAQSCAQTCGPPCAPCRD